MNPLRAKEGLVGRGIGVLAEGVAQVAKERLELVLLCSGALDTTQNFADIAAVVAVVEEGDVLVGTESGQELGQGTWSLGKLEHEETLVRHAGATSNKEANVALHKLIIAEVLN